MSSNLTAERNTSDFIPQSPLGLTFREVQVLLKNRQSTLNRNLLLKKTAPNSQKDLSFKLNEPIPTSMKAKVSETDLNHRQVDVTVKPNNGMKQTIQNKESKTLACTLLVDLLFEEFQLKDITDYVGKPLRSNVETVFIFDEKATKELKGINKDPQHFRCQETSEESNNQFLLRKPPPLPVKPNNLISASGHQCSFQTFPIHKAVSLVEPLSSRDFRAPQLPKRNGSPNNDIPPVPPVRTTSMLKPGINCNDTKMHLPDDLIRSMDLVVGKGKKRNSWKSKISSLSKTNGADSHVNKTLPNEHLTTSAIQSFTKDDVPFVDDPDSLDYHVEVSSESLSTTEPEDAIKTPISKAFPSLSHHFNSLPRMLSRGSNDQMFSQSYHNLDSCATRGQIDSEMEEDEDLNHYETISHSPDTDAHQQNPLKKQERNTKLLKKNELLVVDPNFFDFQVSPNKKTGQLSSSTDRLLKTLFHQYDVLEETGNANPSTKCENFLTTACDREGNLYFVPKFALRNLDDVSDESWFYPLPLTTSQATCFLKDLNQFGSFVVYQAAKEDGTFYLSVCVPDDVIHYRIERDTSLNYKIKGSSRSFPTLKNLIEFYKGSRDSLVARLKRSAKEIDFPIRPGFNYPISYEVNRKDIKFSGEVIGVGYFGTICIGAYNDQRVSIEVFESEVKNCVNNKDKEDAFVEMISIVGKLEHSNIIKMIGVSCQNHPCYFILEMPPMGTLAKFLKSGQNIAMTTMLDVCCQMSAALSHLASKTYIIHRNVNCGSFVVFEGANVKLSGFHKARRVSEDVYISSPSDEILIKWASPEVLIDQVYTTKSDVWSLAVSMWQIFMKGEDPYSSVSAENSAISILQGEILSRPSVCPKTVYDLMTQCWKLSILDRPCATRLNRILMTLKMHCYDEIEDRIDSEEVQTGQKNIKNIPEHEAPAVGIVRLRKKFFAQKSSENHSSRESQRPDSSTTLDGLQEFVTSCEKIDQQNEKKLKKSAIGRIFSLSDLNFKLRPNDNSMHLIRAEHSKSFQVDSSFRDKLDKLSAND